MITIESLQLQHLPQVQALVNVHLSALMPGWSVTEAFIAGQIRRNPGQYITDPWVIERATLCAVERQRVVAAAHLLRYGTDPEVSGFCRNQGAIDWFFAWPDAGEAAQAVLAAAQSQFAAWGVSNAWADGGALVGPFAGVPDVWPHIGAALRAAGYQPDQDRDELTYGGRLDQVVAPGEPPVAGLTLRRTAGSFGTRFTALLEQQPVGYCECIADLTEGGALPALAGWAELAEVEIEPEWQRRGIGTWLVRHAVGWLRFGRCDRIVLAVGADSEDAGAGRFYQRFGWERVAHQQRAWQLTSGVGVQEQQDDQMIR
jgi:GNAT superfamily N-acetyltransferase